MYLPSGTQLGPYRIEAPIGAGGMGEVYRATDTRLKRDVAVKVLSSHLTTDSSAKQRFEREAHTASALNDPHICTIYDVGEHEGQKFLVMELPEGQTLKQYTDGRALPVEQVVRLGTQIAGALQTAHSKGIIQTVLEATAESAGQAEKEWQNAAHSRNMRALSAAPAINVKPVSGGVEIAVRFITRASERYKLRSKLYQTAMNSISKKDEQEAVSISEKPDPKPA